jgi:hypothetical protein
MWLPLIVALASVLLSVVSARASTTSVHLSRGGVLHSGETIEVSIGPNELFASPGGERIALIECEDPGGEFNALPSGDETCDGQTYAEVIAGRNGSFRVAFTVLALPSASLGETPSNPAYCNSKQVCVLYVGEDYTNFGKPHLFSAPFTVATGTASASASTTVPAAGVRSTASKRQAGGSGSWIVVVVIVLALAALVATAALWSRRRRELAA